MVWTFSCRSCHEVSYSTSAAEVTLKVYETEEYIHLATELTMFFVKDSEDNLLLVIQSFARNPVVNVGVAFLGGGILLCSSFHLYILGSGVDWGTG